MAADQRPLQWVNVPITFNAKYHPERTAVVGLLPLVVVATIDNVRVS
jgi:hypothetical protein